MASIFNIVVTSVYPWPDRTVTWAAGWKTGEIAVRFSAGRRHICHTASQPALGHNQPSTQQVLVSQHLAAERPVREAGHSPPSRAAFKNGWNRTSTPSYAFTAYPGGRWGQSTFPRTSHVSAQIFPSGRFFLICRNVQGFDDLFLRVSAYLNDTT